MKAGDSFMNDLLALSHVPRWVIVRADTRQSVADHSFRTAVIAMELWRRLEQAEVSNPGVDPAHLVMYALVHDVDESVTGDLSSIIKDRSGRTVVDQLTFPPLWAAAGSFTAAERDLVKLAEKIEEYTWLVMNGAGYHAQEVCDAMMDRLRANYGGNVPLGILPELIREIVMEEGRLRVHADFPGSIPPPNPAA